MDGIDQDMKQGLEKARSFSELLEVVQFGWAMLQELEIFKDFQKYFEKWLFKSYFIFQHAWM